jgi:hypothetical protein
MSSKLLIFEKIISFHNGLLLNSSMSITTLRDEHDFTKLNENLIDVTFNSIKTNDSLWFLKNVLIPVDSDIVELPPFDDIGVVMNPVLCAAKELYLKYKIISNYYTHL